VQWHSNGARGHVPCYFGQTRSCDSHKSEKKVRGTFARPLFLVIKYSTEDIIGLLITDDRMVLLLCMVFDGWSSESQLMLNRQSTVGSVDCRL
jgi:hypothetical protein